MTVHTYWPQKDGVQYVTQYLAEGLAKKKNDVTIVTSVNNKEREGEESHNGVRIIRVYLKTRYSVFVAGKKEYRQKILRLTNDCDVMVNCCVQSPINNLILSMLKNITCKKVLYLHGMHDFAYRYNGLNGFDYYTKHTLLNIRWLLFYTWHRKDFGQYNLMIDIHQSSRAFSFFNKLGIHVPNDIINNAVEDFSTVPEKKILVESEKYFLCVANYVERKNQQMLIEAFEKIKETKDFKLVLIGKSSEYSIKLKNYIEQNKLYNRIFLIENLDRETTCAYIKNCFCAVMSSLFEVYPIFLCESLSCGHPYISTDVGCIKNIPGGVVVNTVDELASKIEEAIHNPDKVKKLGEIGRSYAAQNFVQEKKVDYLEDALRNC